MIKWGQEAGQSFTDEREACGGLMVKGLTLPYVLPHESNKRRWSLLEGGACIEALGPLENPPIGVQTNAFDY